ncbi:MAG: hypothetical protein VXY55_04940, partial [Pseudomonadota bacterium]|nr:hypothetical protein [Pseudomonadota bacterium]
MINIMHRIFFLKLYSLAACFAGTIFFLIPSWALADVTQKALELNSLIVTGKRTESLKQNMPGNIKVILEDETFIHPVEA